MCFNRNIIQLTKFSSDFRAYFFFRFEALVLDVEAFERDHLYLKVESFPQ